MSNPSFREAWQEPPEIVPAQLAAPVQRRTAPLAGWFMLTAVMAAFSVVLASALTGRDWDTDLPEFFGALVAGGICGAALGGVTGLFDQSPLRGGILGALMGGLVGFTAVSASAISPERINVAFHSSALAAVCIFASALMGRWNR